MIQNLENKLKFIELMDEMKNIERTIFLKNGRQENNAEHSFHLAMMVLILVEDFPNLDSIKCIKMALLHDIVEVFAGDTAIFDVEMEATKEEREGKAILQLEKILGEKDFKNIKNIIEEYMDNLSIESEFVHQIDKFQPIMQIVMEGGKSWQKWKFEKEKIKENKYKNIDDKFGIVKLLDIYFEKAEKEGMFYQEK